MIDSADQIDRIRAEMRRRLASLQPFAEGEAVWVRARFISSGFEGNAAVEVYEYEGRRHRTSSHVDQIRRELSAHSSSELEALLDALDAREARIKELEAGLRKLRKAASGMYECAERFDTEIQSTQDAIEAWIIADRDAARLLAPAAGSEGSGT